MQAELFIEFYPEKDPLPPEWEGLRVRDLLDYCDVNEESEIEELTQEEIVEFRHVIPSHGTYDTWEK